VVPEVVPVALHCLPRYLRFQTMSDENAKPEGVPDREAPEKVTRSLSDVVQGAQALGVATGGVGTLLIGVAKVKEAFGGGDGGGPAPQADPPPPPDEPK
jgi:hypothetical protein